MRINPESVTELSNMRKFSGVEEEVSCCFKAWRIDYDTKRPRGSLRLLNSVWYVNMFRDLADEDRIT